MLFLSVREATIIASCDFAESVIGRMQGKPTPALQVSKDLMTQVENGNDGDADVDVEHL